MIGDAYFDLREQLGTDLFKLAQLVQTHGAPPMTARSCRT